MTQFDINSIVDGQTYPQTYDAENRLVSVTVNNHTTQFVYDGDGSLIKKIAPNGIGGVYEVEKATCGSRTPTKAITYYQRYDPGLRLYRYQARFYSPAQGRFIQPDTDKRQYFDLFKSQRILWRQAKHSGHRHRSR